MKKKVQGMNPKLNRTAWLFIVPSLVLIVLFVFYPMVQAFLTSFQTGTGNHLTFAGLANYKRMLKRLRHFRKRWSTRYCFL